jgi:hypothetical protein
MWRTRDRRTHLRRRPFRIGRATSRQYPGLERSASCDPRPRLGQKQATEDDNDDSKGGDYPCPAADETEFHHQPPVRSGQVNIVGHTGTLGRRGICPPDAADAYGAYVVPASVRHFESAWSQTTQPRRSPRRRHVSRIDLNDHHHRTGSSVRPPANSSARIVSAPTSTASCNVGNRETNKVNTVCSSMRASGAPRQYRAP